jgi:hypothetical protein
MGIRILEGEYDHGKEGAVLIDSVTERPLFPLPLFACGDAAEDFERYARRLVGDIRTVDPKRLDDLHTAWLALVCDACWTRDCDCEECGRPCAIPCGHDGAA